MVYFRDSPHHLGSVLRAVPLDLHQLPIQTHYKMVLLTLQRYYEGWHAIWNVLIDKDKDILLVHNFLSLSNSGMVMYQVQYNKRYTRL